MSAISTDTVSTRRSLLKGGAFLAAPLAVAAPAAAMADDGRKARLDRLETEAAIRELHQSWLREVNAAGFDRSIRDVAADHVGDSDAVTVAADGQSARGRYSCTVTVETAIPPDGTLAQMAHAQGGGVIHSTERRLLKAEYVKTDGAWTIAKIEFALV